MSLGDSRIAILLKIIIRVNIIIIEDTTTKGETTGQGESILGASKRERIGGEIGQRLTSAVNHGGSLLASREGSVNTL